MTHTELLEELVGAPSRELLRVVLGEICDASDPAAPRVSFAGGEAVRARALGRVPGGSEGLRVVLAFEDGDLRRPVVLGLLDPSSVGPAPVEHVVHAHSEGDALVIDLDRDLVLRAGDASITLTRSGKLLLKGAYVSTHSTGINRIKGAAVEIN